MNKIILLCLYGLILASFSLGAAPKKSKTSLFILYKSQTTSLELKDSSLIVTRKTDVYDNPVSSIPSSTQKEETKYTLSRQEISELSQFIKSSGFFDLEKESGAPSEERHYPTSIFIKLNSRSNEVIHRSNPSFESAPETFSQIEKYLLELRK
jgi:hypothetical protein